MKILQRVMPGNVMVGSVRCSLLAALCSMACTPLWSGVINTARSTDLGAQSAGDVKTMNTVRSTIHERFPDLKIEDVRPSPLPGYYEVFTGTQLLYSDSTADHLFVGKLIETRTKRDLAEQQLEKRLTIDFSRLPFDKAIKIVKGTGARRLALFEDPDCPYCQKLEQELAHVNDVTLYVFLYPFVELHPQARQHAHAIWCASDRAAAWTQWMLERKDPGSAECTGDPVDALQKAGSDIDIAATPTFFLETGRRIQGTLAAAQLEQLLLGSSVSATVAAAPVGPRTR